MAVCFEVSFALSVAYTSIEIASSIFCFTLYSHEDMTLSTVNKLALKIGRNLCKLKDIANCYKNSIAKFFIRKEQNVQKDILGR